MKRLPLLPLVLSALPLQYREHVIERPRGFENDSVRHGQQPHKGSSESLPRNSIDYQICIETLTSHSQSNGFVKRRLSTKFDSKISVIIDVIDKHGSSTSLSTKCTYLIKCCVDEVQIIQTFFL